MASLFGHFVSCGRKRPCFRHLRKKCYIATGSINLCLKRWKRRCLSCPFIMACQARTYYRTCNLVILDDLMEQVTSSSDMESLFVKGVHHLHFSVLYINQNLYCKGKHSRTINLNTHIYVLMKNPRDVSQLQCLARQAFLGKSTFLMEAYKDATSQPYGYLVLDFSPGAEEAYRVRTRVFDGEDAIIYQPP